MHVDFTFATQAFGQPKLFLGIVGDIQPPRALGQTIERWAGEVEVALIDQRAHLGEEEGHQQAGDMGAVDVSVGHNDDFIVAQVIDFEAAAHLHAQSLANVADFGIFVKFTRGRAQHVEDFTL